jgi:hypothetical protein
MYVVLVVANTNIMLIFKGKHPQGDKLGHYWLSGKFNLKKKERREQCNVGGDNGVRHTKLSVPINGCLAMDLISWYPSAGHTEKHAA